MGTSLAMWLRIVAVLLTAYACVQGQVYVTVYPRFKTPAQIPPSQRSSDVFNEYLNTVFDWSPADGLKDHNVVREYFERWEMTIHGLATYKADGSLKSVYSITTTFSDGTTFNIDGSEMDFEEVKDYERGRPLIVFEDEETGFNEMTPAAFAKKINDGKVVYQRGNPPWIALQPVDLNKGNYDSIMPYLAVPMVPNSMWSRFEPPFATQTEKLKKALDYSQNSASDFRQKVQNGGFRRNEQYDFVIKQSDPDKIYYFLTKHPYLQVTPLPPELWPRGNSNLMPAGHASVFTTSEQRDADVNGKAVVIYAGEFKTDGTGKVTSWNNKSGHFMPSKLYKDLVASKFGFTEVNADGFMAYMLDANILVMDRETNADHIDGGLYRIALSNLQKAQRQFTIAQRLLRGHEQQMNSRY